LGAGTIPCPCCSPERDPAPFAATVCGDVLFSSDDLAAVLAEVDRLREPPLEADVVVWQGEQVCLVVMARTGLRLWLAAGRRLTVRPPRKGAHHD
jgi:hypothetical protein